MCTQCDLARFPRCGLLTSGLLTASAVAMPSLPAWAQSPPPNAISPDEAIQRLQQGNARYADNAPSNKDNLTDALSEPTAIPARTCRRRAARKLDRQPRSGGGTSG